MASILTPTVDYVPRSTEPLVLSALADTPVVLVHGARQTGKSTLVRRIAETEHPATYTTLDDAVVLAAALGDAQGYLAGLGGAVVIDEVQRAPGLLLAIKAAVDRERTPGRFLLTGSAHVLQLPRLSETLTGRMEIHTLWPFSQGELARRRETFIDRLFDGNLGFVRPALAELPDLIARVTVGGFPEAVSRAVSRRRNEWFSAYLSTVLAREVREVAEIEGRVALPRLMSLVAARVGGLANYADLGRAAGIPRTSLIRYLAILETTFIIFRLPAWSTNLNSRVSKAPKLYLCDTGLLSSLLHVDDSSAARRRELLGSLLENFAVAELVKQASWHPLHPVLHHYRTYAGDEVDVVLEARGGAVAGIEVKAAATVGARDFRGLRGLSVAAGESFASGVLLYTGTEVVPFGERLFALPFSALWE